MIQKIKTNIRFSFALIITFLFSHLVLFSEECPLGYKKPWHKTISAYCEIGQMVKDDYFPSKKYLCEEMHVDHMISLKRAFCAGVSGENLKKLANDPRNIKLTYGRFNQSKGQKSLSSFLEMIPKKQQEKVLLEGVELMNHYKMPIDGKLSRILVERLNLSRKIINKNNAKLAKLTKNLPSIEPKKVIFKGKKIPAKDAIQTTIERIAKRASIGAARNITSLPAEALPFIGVAAAIGVTAWELKDACDTITDLVELDQSLHPNETLILNKKEVCGMKVPSKEEILKTVKNSPSEVWEKARSNIPNLEKYKDFKTPDIDWEQVLDVSKANSKKVLEKSKEEFNDMSNKSKKILEKSKEEFNDMSNKLKGFFKKE